MSSQTFADLGVPAEAVAALRARNLTSPFPIQAQAIPPALEGRDVCGRAPTGSGKTIAFGLPVALKVAPAKSGRPTALILAPTRELAAQIETEMALLLGRQGHKRVASFYGGVGFGPQLAALRRGISVAVACPGRLADLVRRGALDLSDVSIVVIDEADRMADMGFLPEVKKILDQVKPNRQTLLFSATLDGEVDVLIKRYQTDPVRVSVAAESSHPDRTVHHWVDARREDRVALTAHYVHSHGSTVVFCRTKHGTDRLARQLADAGVKSVPIHGGRSQAQRDRALAAFQAGKVQALVATDVAARGIHVDDVRCVVHFDLAGTDKDYMHRSGRTGRAGADGMVVSFVTQSDGAAARSLQKALSHPVSPKWGTRGLAEVPARRPEGDRPRTEAARRPEGDRPRTEAARRPEGDRPGPDAARKTQDGPFRQNPSRSDGSRPSRGAAPGQVGAAGAPRASRGYGDSNQRSYDDSSPRSQGGSADRGYGESGQRDESRPARKPGPTKAGGPKGRRSFGKAAVRRNQESSGGRPAGPGRKRNRAA